MSHFFFTFSSLSAARLAYMVGCKDKSPILVACGNEDNEQERLGNAMRSRGGTPEFFEVDALDGAREVIDRICEEDGYSLAEV